MSRVVDGLNADEAIIAKFYASNAAIGCAYPDGAKGGSIERAHQVQRQDADGSGVREDGDLTASVLMDDAVKEPGAAV